MRYRGTLHVPGEVSREGLPVHVLLTDRHIELVAGDESLGRYPLRETAVERISGDRFDLTLSGDTVVFEADDAIAFSYEAVPYISSAHSAPVVSDRVRRWWASRAEVFEDDEPGGEAEVVSPISRLLTPSSASGFAGADRPPTITDLRPLVLEELASEPAAPARSAREMLSGPSSVCHGLTAAGELCGSTDLGLRGFCPVHDPDRLAERRLARDRLETATVAAESVDVGSGLTEVVSRLEKAVAEVHEGVLDPQRAAAMAALVEAMCHALDRTR